MSSKLQDEWRQREIDSGWLVCEPLLEEERAQRCYRPTYPDIAKQYRMHPVDFSVVDEMIRILDGTLFKWSRAYEHLLDARNERLPRDVREQHFDIAGSGIYQEMLNDSRLPELMTLFVKGNGI